MPKPIEAPDGEPPARIAGNEQAHHEVSGKHPAEIVEGNILHQGATAEAERHAGERGDELCSAAAAHFLRHKPRQHKSACLGERGEKTKARQRGPEEDQGQPAEKRGDRRVGDVAPGQMACVVERGEFIALEAVALAHKHVNDDGDEREIDQQRGVTKPQRIVRGDFGIAGSLVRRNVRGQDGRLLGESFGPI
jgi:hypothetical protein